MELPIILFSEDLAQSEFKTSCTISYANTLFHKLLHCVYFFYIKTKLMLSCFSLFY